jgi:hypothetical protein
METQLAEELHQEMMARLPKNLVTLLYLNYDYSTIREILDSPAHRMENEIFDDYKVRQWLKFNIFKYRHQLPVYKNEWYNLVKNNISNT